jgi:hypothetical protein
MIRMYADFGFSFCADRTYRAQSDVRHDALQPKLAGSFVLATVSLRVLDVLDAMKTLGAPPLVRRNSRV